MNIKLFLADFYKSLKLFIWENINDKFQLIVHANLELFTFPIKRFIFTFDIEHCACRFNDEWYLWVVRHYESYQEYNYRLVASDVTENTPDIHGGSTDLVFHDIYG